MAEGNELTSDNCINFHLDFLTILSRKHGAVAILGNAWELILGEVPDVSASGRNA